MATKLYIKRGSKNYKEQRMLDELRPIIDAEMQKNPGLDFTPATNFEELEELHRRYTSETVTPIEETQNDSEDDVIEDTETETMFSSDEGFDEESSQNIDPFNREEPIVREYVTNQDSMSSGRIEEGRSLSSFQEPLSFQEAFEIPESGESESGSSEQPSSAENQTTDSSEKVKTKENPLNPDWDTMNTGKKKRSTKKFAKYIVETVTMLSEKGFVWYANQDINEAKLTEYEINGEMDLSLLVALEDGQEVTVKQFFQVQCMKAEQLCKIDAEEKADLAEALAEVLLEKGVGPTPTQELILISLKIFGSQAITLMSLKTQTNSLLTQLRSMKEGSAPAQPESEVEYDLTNVNGDSDEGYKEPENNVNENVPDSKQLAQVQIEESGVIERGIETKE